MVARRRERIGPIARLLERIVQDAHARNASEIEITRDPSQGHAFGLVRLRQQGVQWDRLRMPLATRRRLIDRLRALAGLPPDARARLAGAMHATEPNRYPDGRATDLRKALAWGLGGSEDEYVLGSGSDELIALVATAMSTPREGADRPVVVFPEPTFVMYEMTSRAHGWASVGVALDEAWDLDEDTMAQAIEAHRPNVVYYATPNNPTGNCFTREKIERLVDRFPDTLHVVDEAYGAYSGQSYATLCERLPDPAAGERLCALLDGLEDLMEALGVTRSPGELQRG